MRYGVYQATARRRLINLESPKNDDLCPANDTADEAVNQEQGMFEDKETEGQRRKREANLEVAINEAHKKWKYYADNKMWDRVQAHMDVYRFCGEKLTEDPRLKKEYKRKVLEALHLDTEERGAAHYPQLDKYQRALLKEVYERNAAALWIEGTPRTTVRGVAHDTVPTGPPVRTPPHNLKGEAAQWVDDKLEEEVKRGQLERGNSAWGSPPFPTKEFPTHKKQRKRRLVVDYRRVNARCRRAIYFVRRASDVTMECAGSVWMTLVDACAGFNQIVNTERARRMLAIIARSGQFLPRCLRPSGRRTARKTSVT